LYTYFLQQQELFGAVVTLMGLLAWPAMVKAGMIKNLHQELFVQVDV
jgi:hypothetical protein